MIPSTPAPDDRPADDARSPDPGPPAGPATPGKDAPAGQRLVLLVEDEPGVRRVLRLTLEMADFAPIETADGQAALDAFNDPATRIDAAVVDLSLPGVTGSEVVRQMRAQQPDLPIVLTSGWNRDRLDADLREDETIHFLKKPFRPDELLAHLDRARGNR